MFQQKIFTSFLTLLQTIWQIKQKWGKILPNWGSFVLARMTHIAFDSFHGRIQQNFYFIKTPLCCKYSRPWTAFGGDQMLFSWSSEWLMLRTLFGRCATPGSDFQNGFINVKILSFWRKTHGQRSSQSSVDEKESWSCKFFT